jgi:hypothetical protein
MKNLKIISNTKEIGIKYIYYIMSELEIINGNKNLICCFGGMALKMGGIPPFEFLNYLSSEYSTNCDLIFYIDKSQCCYHKGIEGITNNIDETVIYLNEKINKNKYDKIIFMGTSAGGYAAILFGSLCNKINCVISFIPQTFLKKPFDKKYSNLKSIINTDINYILYGDTSIKNIHDCHHISHCENLEELHNVNIVRKIHVNLKQLRDDGTIKKIIDEIIN